MGYVDMRDYSRKMMSDAALAAARQSHFDDWEAEDQSRDLDGPELEVEVRNLEKALL